MKLVVLLSILLLPFGIAAEPRQLLQEGLFEEEANRDLDKASAAYEALIGAFDKDRQYAATALFRLAEIRAKQNRKDDAIALFQRVATEFGNQDPLARLSRERIAALGGNVPASASGTPGISSEENEEIARLQDLIKNSPDLLNDGSVERTSPLGKAAQAGWLRAATFLLDNGANPNGPPGSYPPIHHAISEGRKAMVELLIARGANPNGRNLHDSTPLQMAAERSRLEIARVLLDRGAKIVAEDRKPDEDRTPLHIACSKGDLAMARLLLERKADPNAACLTFLQQNPPVVFGTPLMEAVRSGNPELVTYLLDHGANPSTPLNEGKDSALRTAMMAGNDAITKLLLDRGADPNTPSVVYDAVDRRKEELIRLLASKKANLDAKIPSTRGQTSLHQMARGSIEMTKLLLELGASPKVADDDGFTPLHLAVTTQRNSGPSGRSRIRNLPSAAQSSQNPGATQPGSPQISVDLEICKLLLKHGADINARSATNYTPLHTAVISRTADETFEWLLANGADPTIANTDGKTPLDLANPARRVWLEQRLLYPKLAKQRAIHVFRLNQNEPTKSYRLDPLTEFDSPPDLQEVAAKALLAINEPSHNYAALVFRAEKDGNVEEVVRLDRNAISAGANPTLHWGDILLLPDPGLASNHPGAEFLVLGASFPEAAADAPQNITIRVGDRETTIGLRGEAGLWSPSMGQIPEWRLSTLISHIVGGEPHARLDAVEVQRTVNGEVKKWTVDLRPDKADQFNPIVKYLPARLTGGDKVIIPLIGFDNADALAARKRGIFRAAPGGVFSERVFELREKDDAPRTLGELISESYRASAMVIPEPDFSTIRIRRLEPDGSGENTLTVDLSKAIESVSAKTPQKEARDLDVLLQWGDIVEINTRKAAKLTEWTGLTPQVKLFLTKALSRDVYHRINDRKFESSLFAPTPRDFTLGPDSQWRTVAVPHGSDFRPMRYPAMTGANQVKIRLISRGKTHQYSPEEFRSINPWLLDQDQIEVETY